MLCVALVGSWGTCVWAEVSGCVDRPGEGKSGRCVFRGSARETGTVCGRQTYMVRGDGHRRGKLGRLL